MTTPLRIRLPYSTEEEFLSRYGNHLSHDEMFVATRFPQAEGTAVSFEVVLANGDLLLRGRALIQRADSELPKGQRGMSLEFTELDAESRAFLNKVLGPRDLTQRLPVSEQVPVLGIALGARECRTALWRTHDVDVIEVLPACVWKSPAGHWLVGKEAQKSLSHTPDRGAFVPTQATLHVQGETFSPSELLSVFLKHLVDHASRESGQTIRHGVMTIPTTFNFFQRAELVNAANQAGIEVLSLLNETSAIALAHAKGRKLARKRLLVAHMGHRALSTAVVLASGDDFEVLSASGHPNLGSDRLDECLKTLLRQKAGPEGLAASMISEPQWSQLSMQAREGLTQSKALTVALPWAGTGPMASPVALQLSLTRAEAENATRALCATFIETVENTIKNAGLTAETLDGVVLVGETWNWPMIQDALGHLLGTKTSQRFYGPETIALGAALWSHALSEQAKGKASTRLSDVLTAPIWLTSADGTCRMTIDRNTRLPAEVQIPPEESPQKRFLFQGVLEKAPVAVLQPGTFSWLLSVNENGLLSAYLQNDTGQRQRLELSSAPWPENLSLPTEETSQPLPRPVSSLWSTLRRWFGRGA